MHDPLWTTADGRKLRIGDMSYEHVVNCIRKIERSGGRWRVQYLARLKLELVIRRLPK